MNLVLAVASESINNVVERIDINSNSQMMSLSGKITPEKPWAILGITRRQYDVARPWKKAKMSKEDFAKLVRDVPPEAIKNLKEHADAEMLLEAAFGNGVCRDSE